jgi:predicted enzyme related to lactoylglutathione lyase
VSDTRLSIPAPDPPRAVAFYQAVFGWTVDNSKIWDGAGQVVGQFVSDQLVVGDGGVLPYIYVDSVSDTLTRVTANGGEVAAKPHNDGASVAATFRDPAGNIIGLWQRA